MGGLLYDPARVAAALDDAGASALVVATAPNVLYLTRYRKGGAALAAVRRDAPDRPILVIPAGDIDFLLEDVAEQVDVRAHGRFHRFRAEAVELESREHLIESVAREAREGVGGVELLADTLDGLRVGGTVVTDVVPAAIAGLGRVAAIEQRPEVVRRLRMIKTPEEIRRLARAAEQTERAIGRTNSQVCEGISQAELAREFAIAVVKQGSRIRLDNVSVGRGTALGNVNQPGDVVTPGAVIRYDVGVVHEGYVSDLSRCFAFAFADERVERFHGALVAGQAAALAALGPGVDTRALFELGVAAVREAGIPHYDRINLGHGIGLAGDGYDPPLLAAADETVIEAGMVLCVETPYYELGFAGLQVEDMVVVTDHGYETLTHLPRELEVLA